MKKNKIPTNKSNQGKKRKNTMKVSFSKQWSVNLKY